MNTDDPKLTAFALDELGEPEKSAIARTVAESPEAQRYVDETRKLSQALKNEFAAELTRSGDFQVADHVTRRSGDRRSLIDIQGDRWFWSIARPLAFAAAIAICAIIAGVVFFAHRNNPAVAQFQTVQLPPPSVSNDVEADEAPAEVPGPTQIPNPLSPDTIRRIDRVVIGELNPDSHFEKGEIRLIETINDAYRIERLKQRLSVPILSKKLDRGVVGRTYQLMFLDRNGRIVTSAGYYRVPGLGFVLQPSKHGYERDGHYFPDRGDAVLPGSWRPDVDYSNYVIPFSDWSEGIGYSPGA